MLLESRFLVSGLLRGLRIKPLVLIDQWTLFEEPLILLLLIDTVQKLRLLLSLSLLLLQLLLELELRSERLLLINELLQSLFLVNFLKHKLSNFELHEHRLLRLG